MARNKYPEKTKQLIIDKALILFKEKGYKLVVMQDIIDATGLSRGALYHHFKDKDDVLNEVVLLLYKNDLIFYENMMKKNLNAIQRIDEIINFVTNDSIKKDMSYGLWIQNNPIVLFSNLKNTILNAAPAIETIILQGIDEGFCNTSYPLQAAELIMLMLNIWLDPSLFDGTIEQYNLKIDFMIHTLNSIGVPLISKESEKKLRNYYCDFFNHLKDTNI